MPSRSASFHAAATLAALLATSCATARYKPKGQTVPYEGFYSAFPSGMRLVVYEMPHIDRFMFAVSYRAGAVDDPDGKEGLAHLVEHMAFRGTPGGPGTPAVWDRLQASGLAFNALTSQDETTYYQVGKVQELRATLELEAARMGKPLAGVSEDDFAIERDVVISEYRERFETSSTGAELQFLREATLPGHRYMRPVAGTPESLRRIRLDDVRRWFAERYTPAHAVLVLVSPVPAREATRMVGEAFGEQLGDPASPVRPVVHEPPALPPDRDAPPPIAIRQAPVSQPHIWVGWAVPGSYSRNDLVQETAAQTLKTLFFRKLVEWGSYEFLDEVGGGVYPMDGVSIVYLVATLKEARKDEAERVLEAARSAALLIRYSVLDVGRTLGELRSAWMVNDYVEIEALDAIPIAQYLRITGQPDFLAGRAKDLVPPLSTDVINFAEKYLTRERSAAVMVVPDANGAPIVAGAAAERRDDLDEESTAPPADPALVAALARPPGLDRAERKWLPNGLEVVLLKRGTLPVAEARLVLRTDVEGSPEAPTGLPAVTMWAARGSRSLGRDLSRVGSWQRSSRTDDSLMHGLRGSSANLDALVEGVARWAREIHADEITWSKDGLRRDRERAVKRPESIASEQLARRLFPGHPYGVRPTAAGAEALRQEQADQWMDRQFRPDRATLVVVSNEPPSPELWGAIEGPLAGWRRGQPVSRAELPPPPLPAGSAIALVPRPGATQAQILVGVRQPPMPQRDEPASEALGWLLRARLVRKLRVEEGVTYGLGLSAQEHLAGSALVVSTAVDAGAAAHGVRTILSALGSLATEPLAAPSVARARWQVARSFGQRFDTVDRSAAALERLARWGLPPDHYERMAGSIAQLDGDRIRAAARALAIGHEVIVVLGDERTLLPQLRSAGFEVEVVKSPEKVAAGN